MVRFSQEPVLSLIFRKDDIFAVLSLIDTLRYSLFWHGGCPPPSPASGGQVDQQLPHPNDTLYNNDTPTHCTKHSDYSINGRENEKNPQNFCLSRAWKQKTIFRVVLNQLQPIAFGTGSTSLRGLYLRWDMSINQKYFLQILLFFHTKVLNK